MTDTFEIPTVRIPTEGERLGDLLRELGVSADRVLRYPFPGTANE